jgi:hypothetical protein
MTGTTVQTENAEGIRNGGAPGVRAFISASEDADTKALREILGRMGITAVTAEDAISPGMQVGEAILEALEGADIVIGVIGGEVNPNVAFEVGMARGLGKRMLIITEDQERSAVDLFGGPYIRTRPDNAEAVEFALKQVLAVPHHGRRPATEPVQQTHAIEGLADELLSLLRERKVTTEEDLVHLICRAVEASGVTAASREKVEGVGVDLAVWSDDLEPWVHNPLIIEVRSFLRTRAEAEASIQLVLNYMAKTRVTTALVLYLTAAPAALEGARPPNVLFMAVGDFLEALRHSGFGAVIRDLRNKAIDGAS